jgi:hypothetical protein
MQKKFKIISILLVLSSLMCRNSLANPLVLKNGFGAPGNFVFTTIAGSITNCELKGTDTPLTIYVCLNPPGNDCSVLPDHLTSEPGNGDFTLVAGNTYHLSGVNVKQMSNGYHTNYGNYPNKVQIANILCSNGGRATLSSSGMYNASCNSSGCTTSDLITVTFP